MCCSRPTLLTHSPPRQKTKCERTSKQYVQQITYSYMHITQRETKKWMEEHQQQQASAERSDSILIHQRSILRNNWVQASVPNSVEKSKSKTT